MTKLFSITIEEEEKKEARIKPYSVLKKRESAKKKKSFTRGKRQTPSGKRVVKRED